MNVKLLPLLRRQVDFADTEEKNRVEVIEVADVFACRFCHGASWG